MKLLATLLLALTVTGCAEDDGRLTCDEAIVMTPFRVDAVNLADSDRDSVELGADLDGDDKADNQASYVIRAVFAVIPRADVWRNLDELLDTRLAGDVDWQLELSTCPRTSASQLALTESGVPLGALIDYLGADGAGWTDATNARIQFEPDDTGLAGRIAVALAPGYQDTFAAVFARMCTARYAAGGSPDDYVVEFLDRVDTDDDGQITEVELRANSVFVDLMEPDLDTDGDGTPESMSFGLGFHATAAATATGLPAAL